MIARVWHGRVPIEKAAGYDAYLAYSELGVPGYRIISGNRGALLLRRADGQEMHFLLISLWDSEEAIRRYAGPDMERAQYFAFDLECLMEPEPNVTHYEVVTSALSDRDPD